MGQALENDYITDKIVEDNETIIFKHKSRIFAKTIQIKRDGKRNNNKCKKWFRIS